MDVSILIVHFGNPKLTKNCLKSIYKSNLEGLEYEILILDNTPNKNYSRHFAKYPNLKYIKTKKNNYCYAQNLGIKNSNGEFVVFMNQDIQVDKNWLKELLNTAKKNEKIGCVMPKILFSNSGKINSLGVKVNEDYYFEDIGFNKKDSEDLNEHEIKSASGCSVLFRKSALEDIGGLDEDFVLYLEDVELSERLKNKGWKIILCPKSIIYHDFHGIVEKSSRIPWYFCNRNRFLFLAKHEPQQFARQIKKAHPYKHKEYDELYKFVHDGIYKLVKENNAQTIEETLPDIMHEIAKLYPIEKLQNIINKAALLSKLRKPKICFYDHALHFPGGGQKYGLTIASAIQNDYEVTLIGNKKVSIGDLESWYDLDLKKCKIKIIDIPINENDELINPTLAEIADLNPFSPVEDEIMDYDLLINVNMTPHINPHSLKSIFLCHFPDGAKKNHFYVKNYDLLITNSKYTSGWITKKWNLEPSEIVYPPVDMEYKDEAEKENIILSVSRFEEGGTKKQFEMVKIFTEMCKNNKELAQNWKLILAGGSTKNNHYFNKINKYVQSRANNIELYRNLPNNDLKKLYARSKIFWHACGLNENPQKHPQRIEHFGMTTVEAMQNKCVPIVIDGGGQREIINHGKNGFKFSNEKKLKKYTLKLIQNPKLIESLNEAAYKDSKKYNKTQFQDKFKVLIKELVDEIYSNDNYVPEIHEVKSLLTSA
ncbi:glycosyltransferase [Patescibacteria group bacterium]